MSAAAEPRLVRVCALDDVVPGTANRFEVDGVALCLVRIDDDVYALADRCSHANVALSEGEVFTDTREVECVRHGSAFSLETGEPHALPATQPVRVYEVRVQGGDVLVEV